MKKEDWTHFVLCAACGIVGAMWLLIVCAAVQQHWPQLFARRSNASEAQPAAPSLPKAEQDIEARPKAQKPLGTPATFPG